MLYKFLKNLYQTTQVCYLISLIQEKYHNNQIKCFSFLILKKNQFYNFLNILFKIQLKLIKLLIQRIFRKIINQYISNRITFEEPNIITDQKKNLVNFHISVFQELLNNYNKKNSEEFLKLDDLKQITNDNDNFLEKEERVIQMNQQILDGENLSKKDKKNQIILLIF
ncbi:unnamed protein product [Paramecium sonneborni]|uniref:Uncharacterized protein n=1 Tax=Paramecium sonneborni TaxID=65129 RepID=A0A8S1RSV3_9CILI|nr:unnamed protein product [Paramecium sonneborni]